MARCSHRTASSRPSSKTNVLRAVLRLVSDPVEEAERYHHEARRALQETPVVAIVDAGERQPGRRLPFDLLEVSDVVFHPKTVLLLYREHARLQIGSGNLTFAGYSGNTELFLCVELAYSNAADTALLLSIDEHLNRIRGLIRRPGTQLDLFREELQRRVRHRVSSDPRTGRLAFLDSTTGPIIEQFAALLPNSAIIHSLGMLAPFYERDDAAQLDATSVFGALARRVGRNAVLDVGVAWDNPQIRSAGDSPLEDGLDRLWTWIYEHEGTRIIEASCSEIHRAEHDQVHRRSWTRPAVAPRRGSRSHRARRPLDPAITSCVRTSEHLGRGN